MLKVALILSGCGHLDGAEIREAVLSLLYLDQNNAEVSIFAPNISQHHAIDHVSGKELEENRNILTEAARIARGKISPLETIDAAKFDALVIPGGFGVAKNLSDFAFKGKDCKVIAEFESLIQEFYLQKKPIAAICIAPAILAASLKGIASPTLTIGDDDAVATTIQALGAKHKNCGSDAAVVDEENLIVTCSAYMRDDRISSIAKGIETAISALMKMATLQKKT